MTEGEEGGRQEQYIVETTYRELGRSMQALNLVDSLPHPIKHLVKPFLLDDFPRSLKHEHRVGSYIVMNLRVSDNRKCGEGKGRKEK